MTKDNKFFHGHARFAEEREKLWATQQQAADFFGVSRVTWGQCERGNATPSGEVLAGLAQQGADVNYILTGIEGSAQALLDAKEARIARAVDAGMGFEEVRAMEKTSDPASIEAITALLHECRATELAAVHQLLSNIVELRRALTAQAKAPSSGPKIKNLNGQNIQGNQTNTAPLYFGAPPPSKKAKK